MSLNKNKIDCALAELREQGLEVTVCSALNETWYIKDDGFFTGCIASGSELLELKSANKLNFAVSNHSASVVANWVRATTNCVLGSKPRDARAAGVDGRHQNRFSWSGKQRTG